MIWGHVQCGGKGPGVSSEGKDNQPLGSEGLERHRNLLPVVSSHSLGRGLTPCAGKGKRTAFIED